MAEQNPARFDRHLRLASALTGNPHEEVCKKFVDSRVLLTGDHERLSSFQGRMMLQVAANLIVRFCPKIDLSLPAPLRPLADETIELLNAIDSSPYAEYRILDSPDYTEYGAILCIGRGRTAPRSLRIDGRGWLALLSQGTEFSHIVANDEKNPFGALMAAALGAAEVFKWLVQPLPNKGALFGDVVFSTFSYAIDSLDPGPALPSSIEFPRTLLAGVGAVGNAFLLALSYVQKIRGELMPVDKETIDDPSNLNRYVLAGEADADPDKPMLKTQLAERLFKNSGIAVRPFPEPFEVMVKRLYDRKVAWPEVVISAVDNNDARVVLQKLWPTLLIEGATDNTVGQVSRHEWGTEIACLMCIHTVHQPIGNFSALEHASVLSGLSTARIAAAWREAASAVTQADIEGAPQDKRELLARNIGQPICSVLADLEKIAADADRRRLPIRPTVSFVSMIAGVLAAAEFVKYAAELPSALETLFQLDAMFPLSNAFLQPVEKVKTCYCMTRRNEIWSYVQRRNSR